ncbi:MAG: hypothetical protein K2J49_03240 [Muribaculaceae bacterium]|nr:hypothetical protein [Muribaculaceae bacterium]
MKSVCKKILLPLSLAFGGLLIPASASAQTGEKTLGFAGGYASYNGGGYADLYFQYTFAPHIRIAPEIGYVFRNDCKSAFICSVDVQFPFRIARGFNIYPLAGLTLNSWSWNHHHHDDDWDDDWDDNHHATRGGFDFGGGFDVYLTRQLKLNFQAKYSLMNDTGGWFLNMGIGYNF